MYKFVKNVDFFVSIAYNIFKKEILSILGASPPDFLRANFNELQAKWLAFLLRRKKMSLSLYYVDKDYIKYLQKTEEDARGFTQIYF